MTMEDLAGKIVDEGVPVLLLGGGKWTTLKLNYCPVCGAYVKLNYASGLNYWGVTWRCRKRSCVMSREDMPLDGWNEDNRRSIRTLLKQIAWIIPMWFYRRWAHWKIWRATTD
jgi:hypothetical protein